MMPKTKSITVGTQSEWIKLAFMDGFWGFGMLFWTGYKRKPKNINEPSA